MFISKYFSPELKGYRCLSELTVGILGIGQIGLSSAKLLRGFIFLKQTSATTSNLMFICRSRMQSFRSGEQGKGSHRDRCCNSIFYQNSAPTTVVFRGLSYQHFTLHPRHRQYPLQVGFILSSHFMPSGSISRFFIFVFLFGIKKL